MLLQKNCWRLKLYRIFTTNWSWLKYIPSAQILSFLLTWIIFVLIFPCQFMSFLANPFHLYSAAFSNFPGQVQGIFKEHCLHKVTTEEFWKRTNALKFWELSGKILETEVECCKGVASPNLIRMQKNWMIIVYCTEN